MCLPMHLNNNFTPPPQELAILHLMRVYKKRMAAMLERRAQLLQEQAEHAHDAEAQQRLLWDLESFQADYVFTTIAFPNALYNYILEPDQVGAGRPARGWSGV